MRGIKGYAKKRRRGPPTLILELISMAKRAAYWLLYNLIGEIRSAVQPLSRNAASTTFYLAP